MLGPTLQEKETLANGAHGLAHDVLSAVSLAANCGVSFVADDQYSGITFDEICGAGLAKSKIVRGSRSSFIGPAKGGDLRHGVIDTPGKSEWLTTPTGVPLAFAFQGGLRHKNVITWASGLNQRHDLVMAFLKMMFLSVSQAIRFRNVDRLPRWDSVTNGTVEDVPLVSIEVPAAGLVYDLALRICGSTKIEGKECGPWIQVHDRQNFMMIENVDPDDNRQPPVIGFSFVELPT